MDGEAVRVIATVNLNSPNIEKSIDTMSKSVERFCTVVDRCESSANFLFISIGISLILFSASSLVRSLVDFNGSSNKKSGEITEIKPNSSK